MPRKPPPEPPKGGRPNLRVVKPGEGVSEPRTGARAKGGKKRAAGEPPKPVGRPPHQPTPETRMRVGMLKGYGVKLADIGAEIGIGETALRTHYADELRVGQVRMLRDLVAAVYATARNPAHPKWPDAIKLLLPRVERGLVEPLEVEVEDPGAPGTQESPVVVTMRIGEKRGAG